MARLFEQFVAFGTDIVGLERLMRLIQSICAILTFYPALIPLVLPHSPPKASEIAMVQLSGHLNLTRRALRLFWCLGSFQSGWTGYTSPAAEKSIETWLSIFADSFFGLFGLMESITLLDLLRVKHFSIFGADEAVRMDSQAQGLWLAALVFAALSSGFKIFRVWAYRAVPETGRGFGDEKKVKGAEKRKQEREAVAKETSRKLGSLTRKLLAEVIDLVIPAWSTGLANIDLGTVSVAMFSSTLLTGYAVWERCGQQIDSRRA